jgi:transcriptional regulator with XRE-family HTH domain
MPFLGKTLQALRKRADLSQSQLAEKAGINLQTLQSWEADRRKPKLDALLALAQALGVSLEQLAGAAPKKRKK